MDNFRKLVKHSSRESFEAFIDWLIDFSEKEDIEFVISYTQDPNEASEKIRTLLI